MHCTLHSRLPVWSPLSPDDDHDGDDDEGERERERGQGRLNLAIKVVLQNVG